MWRANLQVGNYKYQCHNFIINTKEHCKGYDTFWDIGATTLVLPPQIMRSGNCTL